MRLKIPTRIVQTMALTRYLIDSSPPPSQHLLHPALLPRSSYAKRCAANDPFTLAAHQQVVTHMESQSHTVFRVPPPPSPHPAFGWLANCLVKITFLAKINSNQSAILEKQKCIKIILGISHTFASPPSHSRARQGPSQGWVDLPLAFQTNKEAH